MRIIDQLPEELQVAQRAVELPEVQDVMRTLAKYNLGVCMPHMHTDEASGFGVLPNDTVQLERDLGVSFVPRTELAHIDAVPVAWKWVDDGAVAHAICVSSCYAVTTQSGYEGHRSYHNSV